MINILHYNRTVLEMFRNVAEHILQEKEQEIPIS